MEVCNIVGTCFLNSDVDLLYVCQKLKINYNPKKFSGVKICITKPKSVCMLFRNGRVTVLGVKKEEDIIKAALSLSEILKDIGIKTKAVTEIEIRNIVGTVNFGKPLKLNDIYEKIRNNFKVNLKPELFPGMKIYLKSKRLIAILFSTGKVIITGAKNCVELENVYYLLLNLLH